MGTARKPFIVVVSVVAFARPVSLLSVYGIVLCFGGVFWYTYARYVEEWRAERQAPHLTI